MMPWIISNIRIFILFLAVSVLNAHMIIPHDHHQADSDFCSENTYPVSKTDNTHHQGLPGHCHAFNDLASGKAGSNLINKQVPVREVILDSVFEAKIAEGKFSMKRIVDVSNLTVLKGLPGLSSLRAPPLFG
jgi:hypothetical protein